MIALLRMVAGLIVWAVAFCVLYALHGLGCAADWQRATLPFGISPHRAVLSVAWVACLAVGGAVAWWLRPPHADMTDRIGWRLAWVGLLATVMTGLPILILPACL